MDRIRTTISACLAVGLMLLAPAAMAAAPNDPGYDQQWGLPKVGAPDAWETSRGGGITVAVVDSGVHLVHEDLKGKLVGGRNFVEDGQPPQDDNGHGSHVAGIVGAATGNGLGVASMAPDARIMPVRALENDDSTGQASGSASDVEDAIRWAADNGAQVINLSLGENVVIRNLLGSAVRDAVEYAWSKGAICIIAAGNDVLFGSGYGNINAIVVSATDRQDRKPSYSNGVGGAKWGMAAPGGSGGEGTGILSTYWFPDNKPNAYAWASGTSMAAPHVAGAAALLRSLGKNKQETVDILLQTADDLGASGRDSTFGSGRLNALRAVRRAAGQPEPAPQPGPGGGGGGETGSEGGGGASGSGSTSPRRTSRPASTVASPDAAGPEATPTSEPSGSPGIPTASSSPSVAAAGDTGGSTGGMSAAGWAAAALGGVVLAGAGGLIFVRLRGGA